MTKSVIVIPARMASTRFPNKPLALISGQTMIERVVAIALHSKLATKVVVSTDDQRIASVIKSVDVILTSSQCQTGTDRVAETVKQLDGSFDIVFSLQGDAVLTPPWIIDDIIRTMSNDPTIRIATPAVLLKDQDKLDFIKSKQHGSSTGTCVVFDKNMKALYFSKGLIPNNRDNDLTAPLYRHIGLYGYRTDALLQFASLEQSPLEKIECLEQLRALENGIAIHMVEVDYRGRTHGSVDSFEDINVIEKIIAREGELSV